MNSLSEQPILRVDVARDDYLYLSKTATYSFLISLPLFIFYELLIILVNLDNSFHIGLSVEFLFKRMLGVTGIALPAVVTLLIILVGVIIYYFERDRQIALVSRYFGWMILESTGYAIVLALVIGTIVGAIFGLHIVQFPLQAGPILGVDAMLVMSIGAGIYEELFFRVILVGGLFWLLRRYWNQPEDHWKAYFSAAVVGALIFSAIHYTGSLGDSFQLASFTFRFLFGLALNALYLLRGFGIAAWTHSLYDVMVTLMAV